MKTNGSLSGCLLVVRTHNGMFDVITNCMEIGSTDIQIQVFGGMVLDKNVLVETKKIVAVDKRSI